MTVGLMQPAAGSGGQPSGGGGQVQPPTPSNFSANMSAKNAAMLEPTTQPVTRFDRFAKPATDGSQFEQSQLANNELPPPEGGEEQPQLPQGPMDPAQQQQMVEQFLQALQQGALPESMLDQMVKVPWGQNGHRDITVKELQQGFLRQSDYTRGKQEVRQQQERLQQVEQSLNQVFQAFGSPETMHQRLMGLGYRKQLEGVARIVYKQWVEEETLVRSLPEDKRAAFRAKLERTKEAEEQLEAKSRRERQLEQQANQNQSQAQQAQNAQAIQRQIDQIRPAAFKALGIVDAPYHRAVFDQQLVAVIQSSGQPFNGQITREQAWAAAQAAKEVLEDDVARARAALPQGQSQPMGPNRLPAGASSGEYQQQRVQGQRRRPSDLESDLKKRGAAYRL